MKHLMFSIMLLLGSLLGGYGAYAQQNGDVIRYALWSNPRGLFHPTLYFTDYDRAVIFSVFARLYTLDDQQNPVPSLSLGHEYSQDGRTLTLTLRDDVTWHDGEKFTAADVAFTYEAGGHADFERFHPFATYLEGYEAYHEGKAENLSGIQVIDDTHISFTFKKPNAAAFAYFVDRPILAKHIWQAVPIKDWPNATELLRNPVGTGSYKFVEFVPDQYVRLERNDAYFAGQPKTQTIIFKISNPQTAQGELINGELDIAEISSWNERDLQTYRDADIRIVEQMGISGQYMPLDVRNPKLSDKRVRQALVHAIDRQAIIDRLLFGHATIFNAKGHPGGPYYPQDLDLYPYNPQKAKELLAEAGWIDSDGDGILDRNGEKFTFTLNYPMGNRTRELSAPIIQQYLKAIGLEVELVSADFNTTLAILQDGERIYDGVLMGSTFRPGYYENDFWWERFKTAEMDALEARYNSTIDIEELRASIGDWLRGSNDAVPHIWLYIPNEGYALGRKVTHYYSHPYEPFIDIANWTVSQ